MILGSTRVLITDQCSSRLFKSNIAMSKIFEYRPVNNRTMRYAAICVLSGNVAFGQNFILHLPIGHEKFAYDQSLRQQVLSKL